MCYFINNQFLFSPYFVNIIYNNFFFWGGVIFHFIPGLNHEVNNFENLVFWLHFRVVFTYLKGKKSNRAKNKKNMGKCEDIQQMPIGFHSKI